MNGGLRSWIGDRLDPLEDRPPALITSDYDLSTAAVRPDDLEQLTPAAVLIGLIEREEGYSVLLTRRVDTMRRHAGQGAFPGGRRDPGATPWQAARRWLSLATWLQPRRKTLLVPRWRRLPLSPRPAG